MKWMDINSTVPGTSSTTKLQNVFVCLINGNRASIMRSHYLKTTDSFYAECKEKGLQDITDKVSYWMLAYS